jgi:hypothetical protein
VRDIEKGIAERCFAVPNVDLAPSVAITAPIGSMKPN